MISEHLSLKEVTKSDNAKRLGIDNAPTPDHLKNLKLVAEKVFEPFISALKCLQERTLRF